MPFYERDGANIYYEEHGEGFPVLVFAPGGMRSCIPMLANMPWNPIEVLSPTHRVIAMDQRNAGQSTAPVDDQDGWGKYRDDQIGLLDHLGIERCHLLGCCIGGSFILGILEKVPERVAAAVLAQPIGKSDENHAKFAEFFDGWAAEVKKTQPDVGEDTWRAFGERMFGGDFVYNMSRETVRTLATPMLVLMGNDLPHPSATSREVADLAPNATLIEAWKEGDAIESAKASMVEFLGAQTPNKIG